MKNRLFILLYLLLLLLIFWLEFHETEQHRADMSSYEYGSMNDTSVDETIQSYLTPLEEDIVNNESWDIVFKKVVEKEQPKVDALKKLDVTLKGKELCVEKECLKLLGIFFREGIYHVSFYNKKAKKSKIENFTESQVLLERIKINKLTQNEVFFKELNSSREWRMKMFDINSSKYKPKEFE